MLKNVPNIVLSFLDVDGGFSLMRREDQDFINRSSDINRYLMDILPVHCHANYFFKLRLIYVGLPWLSEWLFAFLPFFENEESLRKFRTCFYAWFNLFKKISKRRHRKGNNHSDNHGKPTYIKRNLKK